MENGNSPQFDHDCPHCRFERQGHVQDDAVDVYMCPHEIMGPAMIIRKSDEEDDYWSMPISLLDATDDGVFKSGEVLLARQVLAERASRKRARALAGKGVDTRAAAVPKFVTELKEGPPAKQERTAGEDLT